ncbi:MAG: SMI1/KNR4 family protein [Candidatus Peribacteraceae bacterium]|nr:SMI1/KNR4 family protein [Candidatus Peribacteraceae bacterium]
MPDQFFLDFLILFKRQTEEMWVNKELERDIYGFQVQAGTKWLPGLSPEQIRAYEHDIGCVFPHELRQFLSVMNGLDRESINIYGMSGEPFLTKHTVYAYPRDFELIHGQITSLQKSAQELAPLLTDLRISAATVRFVPLYMGSYVVCADDPSYNPVIFCDGSFVELVSETLKEALELRFLPSV